MSKEMAMKVYVYHDSTGAVRSLVAVSVAERGSPMLAPKPGIFVSEVEGEVEDLKLTPEASDLEAFRKMAKGLRVATPTPRTTLIRK
jgi:hypothetical protein